jgi:hypothetical protein
VLLLLLLVVVVVVVLILVVAPLRSPHVVLHPVSGLLITVMSSSPF